MEMLTEETITDITLKCMSLGFDLYKI